MSFSFISKISLYLSFIFIISCQDTISSLRNNENIDSISLISPTTSDDRIKTIVDQSSGFIYYVTLRGVTGSSHFDKSEIIIVDNNSSDDSLHTVNLFKDRTTIKIISINDYTPGKSINLGVIMWYGCRACDIKNLA